MSSTPSTQSLLRHAYMDILQWGWRRVSPRPTEQRQWASDARLSKSTRLFTRSTYPRHLGRLWKCEHIGALILGGASMHVGICWLGCRMDWWQVQIRTQLLWGWGRPTLAAVGTTQNINNVLQISNYTPAVFRSLEKVEEKITSDTIAHCNTFSFVCDKYRPTMT